MGSTNMKIIEICFLLIFSVIYSKHIPIDNPDYNYTDYYDDDYDFDLSMLMDMDLKEDFDKPEKKGDNEKSKKDDKTTIQKDIRSQYIDILNTTSPSSPATSEIGGA